MVPPTLQLLLNPEMVKACPTLISYVYDFLENKAYSKGKGEFARKVPSFFSAQLKLLLRTTCNSPHSSTSLLPSLHTHTHTDRSTPSSTRCAAP